MNATPPHSSKPDKQRKIRELRARMQNGPHPSPANADFDALCRELRPQVGSLDVRALMKELRS